MRASNSFTRDQVKLLEYICSRIVAGQDPSTLAVRHAAFPALRRKVHAMHEKVTQGDLEPGAKSA